MSFQIDEKFMVDCFEDLVNVPSPVGYSRQLDPVLERYAAQVGSTVTYDRRGTAYITLSGRDNSKTVLLSAHADTLGLMVRTVESDGGILVRPVGGINFCNLDGEYVTVHTRSGRDFTGLMTCRSHSLHVYPDARTLERNENTMVIRLDEPVSSREDVLSLGIRNGDYVFLDPHFRYTESGYLKSRFIDDKAAIACVFAALKYYADTGEVPAFRTIFAFPYREEIGQGGCYVPPEVSEFIALDIGLVGPELDGTEHKVSICAKDKDGPYDYELTDRLVSCAEKAGCDYAVDVYYHYSSDAHAAVRGGNNLRSAVFGPGTYGSHGVERTHVSALTNTAKLVLSYLSEK